MIFRRWFNRLRMKYSPTYRAKVYNKIPFEFRISPEMEVMLAKTAYYQRVILQLQLIKAGYMKPEDLDLGNSE